MSYEPTQWKDGDLVTSAKLNKMEQGIAAGSGILIVHEDDNEILDKTWQEIADAEVCYIISDYSGGVKGISLVTSVFIEETYKIIALTSNPEGVTNTFTYYSNSPDDYPTYFNPNAGGGEK